jgi:broad specificity phosphatase PhoE
MPPIRTAATGSAWLIRHGESTWNALGLTQGHADQAELTGKGQRQAAEVAARLAGIPARALYASDLRRARQTAAPVAAALGLPVTPDTRLRERSLGVLEGTLAAGNGPSVTGLDLSAGRITDPDRRPRGGESVRDLYRRAASFADEVIVSDATPAGDIVVIAHGGTLRVLRSYLTGITVEEMDWAALPNATVFTVPRLSGFICQPGKERI